MPLRSDLLFCEKRDMFRLYALAASFPAVIQRTRTMPRVGAPTDWERPRPSWRLRNRDDVTIVLELSCFNIKVLEVGDNE